MHGDNFDEDTWSKFVESRPIKDAEVFLSEIEVLLCDPNMVCTQSHYVFFLQN